MAYLVQANLAMEERMDKHGSRLYKLENLDIPYHVSKAVDEIVTDAVDWAIQAPLRDRFRDSSPPHTTTDTRLKSSVSSIPEDIHMDDDTAPDEQVHSSGDEDIGHDHIPIMNLKQNWWKPLTEDKPATPEPACSDMAIFMDWFCKKKGITELKQQDLEGPAYEIINVFHPNYNVSKPLPLGGPPGQVTIQSDFFFNKDLEYLRYGHKSGRPALLISKMKATYYPEVGLEQMVPNQIQRVEDFQLGIESYQTQLNLTKPRWDATGFEFKHDFTIIDSPRAVIFRDTYGVQMIMCFNEIHKFSDGTLQ
ncbi:hypothetical protein Tco_0636335 [Tanacetum coccineum]